MDSDLARDELGVSLALRIDGVRRRRKPKSFHALSIAADIREGFQPRPPSFRPIGKRPDISLFGDEKSSHDIEDKPLRVISVDYKGQPSNVQLPFLKIPANKCPPLVADYSEHLPSRVFYPPNLVLKAVKHASSGSNSPKKNKDPFGPSQIELEEKLISAGESEVRNQFNVKKEVLRLHSKLLARRIKVTPAPESKANRSESKTAHLSLLSSPRLLAKKHSEALDDFDRFLENQKLPSSRPNISLTTQDSSVPSTVRTLRFPRYIFGGKGPK